MPVIEGPAGAKPQGNATLSDAVAEVKRDPGAVVAALFKPAAPKA